MRMILLLQAEVQVLMVKAKNQRPMQILMHLDHIDWRTYQQLKLRAKVISRLNFCFLRTVSALGAHLKMQSDFLTVPHSLLCMCWKGESGILRALWAFFGGKSLE